MDRLNLVLGRLALNPNQSLNLSVKVVDFLGPGVGLSLPYLRKEVPDRPEQQPTGGNSKASPVGRMGVPDVSRSINSSKHPLL